MARSIDLYEQISLSKEEATTLADFYSTEVRKAIADRADLERRWERAYKLYEGLRPEKNYPWKGASNIHIPLVAIHASAIHARFMTTIFGSEPFWRVRAKNPDLQDFSDAATEHLDWSRQNEFRLYDAVRDFAWDSIKYGLGILKITWRMRTGFVLFHELQKDGTYKIMEDERTIENRPHVEAIAPYMFVWPSDYPDVQTAPWVCHRIRYTPAELQEMEDDGWLHNVSGSIKGATSKTDHLDMIKGDSEGVIASDREVIEVYEIWAKRRVNGRTAEVQIIIDPDLSRVLKYNLNPNFHRKRPFVIGRLESREHSIPGLGISDQIGDINDELNTVHNQTVDATTVSICSMFGATPGTPAWDALADIHPGKRIPARKDEVFEIGLGPLKATSFPIEQGITNFAERRTGISDFGLGREPNPSRRGTATGTLAIIQEGNKKFDYQIKDMREALSEAGGMILSLMQQNNVSAVVRQVLGEDGESFEKIELAFPTEPILSGVSVEVVASSAAINRQVQRQDAVTLFQILMGFYTQSFQLAQTLSIPGMPVPMGELAIQLAEGAKTMMKEVLNSFENRRSDELLPDLEEIYGQLIATGLAEGFAQPPGMAGSPGGVPQEGQPGGQGGSSAPPSGPGGPSASLPGSQGPIRGVGGGNTGAGRTPSG